MKTGRSGRRERRPAAVCTLAAITAGTLVLGTGMTGATALAATHHGGGSASPRAAAAVSVPKGCTGGIAPNPSVEQTSGNRGAPTGYTFTPAAPVPPGTPSSKVPKLYSDSTYTYDGSNYALIQTPDGKVSTAYETQKFVPGGVYTLTDFTGTHAANLAQSGNNQYTGLRFYDASGKVVLQNQLKVTHNVETDKKVAQQDFPPSTAPANATSVKFYAETNYNWVKWDCVYLQLAAYTVKKEVQNPATGAWGPSATIPAGQTAHYRITVTNEGSQDLTGITVKDPWCSTQPAPIDIKADPKTLSASKSVTCDHPNVALADDNHVNTATVSNVTYPGGTLPPKTATATIMVTPPPAIDQVGDFVWIDTNKNGLQDSGEPGVQGVKVTLKDGAGGTVGTATTDASGKYLFDKLKDGTYQVCFDLANLPASVKGYQATKKDAGDDAKDSDADPATGCTPTTTLGPDKRQDLTLDLGLTPPANRLGDFVWVDTNKNGLQDAGEPGVQGVTATLKDGSGKTLGTTTTDASGKYLFDNLNDGTYQVCFDTANLPGQYAGYKLTKKDAGDDAKDSDADTATGCTPTTTLGADKREDLTLDAGIIPPPDQVGDFVWVDTNKNGLQDAGEPGVQGVTVTLKKGDGTLVTTTTTGADGKYLFDGLDDGTYQVCFDIAHMPGAYAGYTVTKKDAGDDAKDSDADTTTGCTPPTTVGPDKRQDLTLDMGLVPPLNRLGDFVWVDTNKNGLQDAGEPGVQGVTATLKDGSGKTLGTTTTDASGKYIFEGLEDGTYQVCFDVKKLPDAYADYTLTKANAGDDAKDSDADVTTGCTATTTLGASKREDLTLDAGIIAPPNKVGDYVWVDTNKDGIQNPTEKGVPGVKVTLKDDKGATVTTGTTDANGKYLFDNLPDGSYQVCFDTKALPADVADFQLTKQNAAGHNGTDSAADMSTGCTPVTKLGPGHREDLTLDAGLISPVNRVGDYVWSDTNANGIQDKNEPGIKGVPVTLKDGNGKTVSTQTTVDGGKYLFDNLPDGSYQVCFDTTKLPADYAGSTLTKTNAAGHNGTDSAADQATKCTPVTKLGQGHREDLTLDAGFVPAEKPANKLGDYVWYDKNANGLQDSGEVGVQGVPVTLKDGSGKVLQTSTTGSGGKYLFGNLPDGSYQVCFDTGNLPGDYKGYSLTKANAAGHNGTDSAADQASKCTPVTKLGPGHREDLTLDAGLVGAPPASTPSSSPSKLASTGSPLVWFAGLGALLLLGGLTLLMLVRRRRTTAAE